MIFIFLYDNLLRNSDWFLFFLRIFDLLAHQEYGYNLHSINFSNYIFTVHHFSFISLADCAHNLKPYFLFDLNLLFIVSELFISQSIFSLFQSTIYFFFQFRFTEKYSFFLFPCILLNFFNTGLFLWYIPIKIL